MRTMVLRPQFTILFLLCVGLAASCERQSEPSSAGSKAKATATEGIRQEVSRGGVKVMLGVDRKEVTVAEQVRAGLEVVAPEGVEVVFPKISENKIGEFRVAEEESFEPELMSDKTVRYRRGYVLEPFLAGEYKVPPLKVTFWKKDKQAEKHELETKEAVVTVKSVLAAGQGDVKVKDIFPPVELPWSGSVRAAVIAGAVLAAILVVGWFIWRRRRVSVDEEILVQIPAHELAFGELERLLAERLVERGLVKEFYYRVSEILRRYIENRFGLHAPERTTEEFLMEIRQDHQLPGEFKPILQEFLNHCDLVKFARFEPASSDIDQTVATCRRFVTATTVTTEAKAS